MTLNTPSLSNSSSRFPSKKLLVSVLLFKLLTIDPVFSQTKDVSKDQQSTTDQSVSFLEKIGNFSLMKGKSYEEEKAFLESIFSVNDSVDIFQIYTTPLQYDISSNKGKQSDLALTKLRETNTKYGDKFNDLLARVEIQKIFENNAITTEIKDVFFNSLVYNVSLGGKNKNMYGDHVVLNDLFAFELHWGNTQSKIQKLSLKYDKEKTEEKIKLLLSKLPLSLDINENVLNIDSEIWNMQHINLPELFKHSFLLDKHVVKQSDTKYSRTLLLRDQDSFTPLKEIDYLLDENNISLSLDENSLGSVTIPVLWYDLPVHLVANGLQLSFHISDEELENFKMYVIDIFQRAFSTLNATTFAKSQDFENLKKLPHDMWEGKSTVFSYHPKYTDISFVNGAITNVRSKDNPLEVKFTKVGDNLSLRDAYANDVSSYSISDGKYYQELSLVNEGNKDHLKVVDKKRERPEYQYLSFTGAYADQLINANATYDSGKLSLLAWSGKQLTEFFVDFDLEKGYSYNELNNQVSLKPEYFYHLLDSYSFSNRNLSITNNDIREKFDQVFEGVFQNVDLKKRPGIIVDGKYFSVCLGKEKTEMVLSTEVPQEVLTIISQIKEILTQLKRLSELDIYYATTSKDKKNKHRLDNFIFGETGAGFGVLEWFEDWDPNKKENMFYYTFLWGDNTKYLINFGISGGKVFLKTSDLFLWGEKYHLWLEDKVKQGNISLFVSPTSN